MVERFEMEVDTTRANEFWRAEVQRNLDARKLADDVPAEQH
ncbi:3-ketosteroid-9-alpha-hydroxylase oxygenase subunit domain protein [Mycobacterium kansasii]|nr:3-ketosteroid-9-alpha-hydroxylase oxygenase subunit domain protein [Mycobacterium kansasii]